MKKAAPGVVGRKCRLMNDKCAQCGIKGWKSHEPECAKCDIREGAGTFAAPLTRISKVPDSPLEEMYGGRLKAAPGEVGRKKGADE